MIYVDKNGNIYNDVVTDKDVIVTSGNQIGKDLKTILDEQQSDINKLKSNVKHIFLNGGVGGNGSGGSGGGSGAAEPVLNVLLNDNSVVNNGSPILLDEPGEYPLYFKVRNSGGKDYHVTYATGNDPISKGKTINLPSSDRCEATVRPRLSSNGSLKVRFYNEDWDILGTDIEQPYIVSPHDFGVRFLYKNIKGESVPFGTANEYYMGSTTELEPYIDITYSINITDVYDINVVSTVEGTDWVNHIDVDNSLERSGHIMIGLDEITKGGSPLIDNSNTGSYKVEVAFKYTKGGVVKEDKRNFTFVLIPSNLFINITSNRDILYSSEEMILAEGTPQRRVNQGSYITFYGYVYEGPITQRRYEYHTTINVYDLVENSDEDEWVRVEQYSGSNLTLTEQTTDNTGFLVAFNTPGIKRIELIATPNKGLDKTPKSFYKYIFVQEYKSSVYWYADEKPEDQKLRIGAQVTYDAFFKTNHDVTYKDFPELPSGSSPYEMKRSGETYTIYGEDDWTNKNGDLSTILSFGIQFSNVNEEDAKIMDIYLKDAVSPDFTLYSTHLFTPIENTDNKIQIPIEDSYNANEPSKYHLVQIIRKLENYDGNKVYIDYLYIDGLLESANWNESTYPLLVSKIVLNNVNVSYNLFNIQYVTEVNGSSFNADGAAYAYNLAYKDKVSNPGSLTESEVYFYNHMNEITMDETGSNVILSYDVIRTFAPYTGIPSMIMEHTLQPNETVESVMNDLFLGRDAQSKSYGDRDMKLYWCNGGEHSEFVEIKVDEIMGFRGGWNYTLQGTSTMRNKIKNFTLKYVTTYPNNAGLNDKIVVSPNFEPVTGNEVRSTTFLPEQEWTIKADIADSAHANNTCMGKFVNEVTTPFQTDIQFNENTKKYIRNTLEGFPVLLFFKPGKDSDESIYYFGVYNFNMGRSSYFNLGYNIHTDELYENCVTTGRNYMVDSFLFTVADCERGNICVGEVQENNAEFDFHQFDTSVLFEDHETEHQRMFGNRDDIVCRDYDNARTTLSNLVKDVAYAGKYCFQQLLKDEVSSRGPKDNCKNVYTEERNQVPSIKYQMKYDDADNVAWYENTNDVATIADLEKLLLDEVGGNSNTPRLDYTSASEYFAICMGFGLVDSVLKNMNIKSWDGTKCYTGFYDMDCALGEENSGKEIVVYNAATDYWASEVNEDTRSVGEVKIYYDYWSDAFGKGFDFPSSYLFSVIKYGKAILGSDAISLGHCPQEFWAELRQPQKTENYSASERSYGELCNVDYFINKYYRSGIRMIPEYLASLNYKVKYLYYDGENRTHIANHESFNGSRSEKVKVWLTKRIQFMDVMMNVMGLKKPIYNEVKQRSTGLFMPIPDSIVMGNVKTNPDVSIAQCAFSTDKLKSAVSSMNTDVSIYAAPNTPFILNRTESNEIYIFPSPLTEANKVHLNFEQSQSMRFYGSKAFVDIDKIEPFFTRANQIISDNLEHIRYSGLTILNMTSGLDIKSTSVKTIDLNCPQLSGGLRIATNGDEGKPYGQSLETINISNSGLYGNFKGFSNLRGVNVSSVNAESQSVTITNCGEFFSGDNCVFSGESQEKKTKLFSITIDNAEGNFVFNNTDIQEIIITSKQKNGEYTKYSNFEINNDVKLKKLTLNGFKRVYIKGCNNLEELTIDGSCLEDLTIDMHNTVTNVKTSVLKYINGTMLNPADDKSDIIAENGVLKLEHFHDTSFIPVDSDGTYNSYNGGKIDSTLVKGIFNLRGCDLLEKLTISNCANVKIIKLPNHAVKVGTFAYNNYLIYVDTDDVVNPTSKRPSNHYPNSKLIITRDSTFKGCPDYAMRTSSLDHNSPYEYTNIEVSEVCTSLANTWDTNDVQRHLNDIYNIFERSEVNLFMGCVKHPENITSLSEMFKGRTTITIGDYTTPITDLSGFINVNNINRMYYDTGISTICFAILNLPEELNDLEHHLDWNEIIKASTYNIIYDALKNISYRIDNIGHKKITICKLSSDGVNLNNNIGTPEEPYNILDFFCPKYEGDKVIPLSNITDFNGLNFNENQYIDFRRMFELFPNIKTIEGFMNDNLSRFNIEGMLKPCVDMRYIIDSFGNSDNNEIDLWDFFDWEHNANILNLFEERNGEGDSFTIKKHISYSNFEKLITILSGGEYDDGSDSEPKVYGGYNNIVSLTNLFRNCTITDYNGEDIVFKNVMGNVNNISHLFDNCTSDNADGTLNIGRLFFTKLPNIKRLVGTFRNVHFDHMLEFDFFCKRHLVPVPVKVGSDDNLMDATLYEYQYGKSIFKMSNCFNGCKFYGNSSAWFSDDISGVLENYIEDASGNRDYNRYKDIESGVWYDLHTYEKEDCYNNFSNFVNNISCWGYGTDAVSVTFNNHPLSNDLNYYRNGYDIYNLNNGLDIFKTYPCLPPDLLYGCDPMVTLDNLFDNSNIIGVIPRHLTKNCQNATMQNIFRNVNILPNVQFFYNKQRVNEYLPLILDIPTVDFVGDSDYDSSESDEYSVVFVDASGNLARRRPDDRESNIGQFVYVPDGFVGGNSIYRVFDFRYNLPKNTMVDTSYLSGFWEGTDLVKTFKNTDELNEAVMKYKKGISEDDPYGNEHHTQYFFTTNKSCDWGSLINATNPFINDYDDITFNDSVGYKNNNRVYYYKDSSAAASEKYMWVDSSSDVSLSNGWYDWNKNTNGVFNSLLNLCGRRKDDGELEDYGCRVDLTKGVKLSSFITGALVTFLNGLIFSTDFRVDKINASNLSGGDVIVFAEDTHFSKNIILPSFTADKEYHRLTFIQGGSGYFYYDFMADKSSMEKYALTKDHTFPDGSLMGFDMNFEKSYKYRSR